MTARRLIGVLLITPGEWVSDDRLTELAWGPMGASRAALHNAVSRLRGWLRASVGEKAHAVSLEHSAARYRIIAPDPSVDVARFRGGLRGADRESDPRSRLEALLGALGEWRGPVLADTSEWIRADPLVAGLEKARLERTCELADLALETGQVERAFPLVEQLAAQMAYDEPLHARVLTMLNAAGRRAEALRHYERLRQGLADELGVDPSPELRDIHMRLLRDDGAPGTALVHVPRQHPPASVIPAMLPRDIVDFTGRVAETAALDRFLTEPSSHEAVDIMVVSGPPGVGKTSVAVHVAHHAKPGFPDGQLFADLRGNAPAPLPPGEVLAQFLRALGRDAERMPEDLGERSALYRTLLAGKRMLIVLDNAADEAQVRPLLPGDSRCRVLVTGRHRLPALEGARRLDLHVPGPDEALDLLTRIVGADAVAEEPGAARTIVDICGRLPLAVRVAGLRLVAQPHRSLGWLVDLLADERHRIGELTVADVALQHSLRLSYEALGEEEGRLFRWLGLLATRDFTAPAAAQLLGCSVAHAERLLDGLVQARLLDARAGGIEGAGTRYSFHDLIRVYARERAVTEPEDRRLRI